MGKPTLTAADRRKWARLKKRARAARREEERAERAAWRAETRATDAEADLYWFERERGLIEPVEVPANLASAAAIFKKAYAQRDVADLAGRAHPLVKGVIRG